VSIPLKSELEVARSTWSLGTFGVTFVLRKVRGFFFFLRYHYSLSSWNITHMIFIAISFISLFTSGRITKCLGLTVAERCAFCQNHESMVSSFFASVIRARLSGHEVVNLI